MAAADVDESPRAGESPRTYVERLAVEKAQRVLAVRPGSVVLAADTTVVVDGRILEKPVDAEDAAAMLRRLSGREHAVLTGVAVAGEAGCQSAVEETRVSMVRLSDAEIADYVASGEPMDKAGAYGIQGRASRFVSEIHGSYTNVVGLPIPTVVRLLAAHLPEFRH